VSWSIEVDAGLIHVRVEGPADGPVVILLHGFASSMHAYDAVARALAADCRVVRVDLLGHGLTRTLTRTSGTRYDSEAQAAMVGSVLSHLELSSVTVVGHSFGADVAIALAESGGVRGVVVIGQAPDYSSARLPRGSALMTARSVGPLLHRLAPTRAVRRGARFAFAPGSVGAGLYDQPDQMVRDFRATAPAMYRTVVSDRPRLLAQRPLDARLRDTGLPALVILGARDQLYPAGPTRARYADVPNARVEVLADSGHSPNLEQPQAVSRLLREFIDEVDPRPGR
jgi:pimeloyl-ACP methyl ester carboxylesterase